MLPSKGFFSRLPCAFYSEGKCQRPHCHYRHSLNDLKIECITELEKKCVLTSEQLHVFTTVIEKTVDQVIRSDPKNPQVCDRNTLVRSTLDQVLTDPGALKTLSPCKIAPLKTALSYQPTPISELNKIHIPVMTVQEKPFLTPRNVRNAPENNWSMLFHASSSRVMQIYDEVLHKNDNGTVEKLNEGEPNEKYGSQQDFQTTAHHQKSFSHSIFPYDSVTTDVPTKKIVGQTSQECETSILLCPVSDSENKMVPSRSKNNVLMQKERKNNFLRQTPIQKKQEVICQIPLSKCNTIAKEADSSTYAEPSKPPYTKRRKSDDNVIFANPDGTNAKFIGLGPELPTSRNPPNHTQGKHHSDTGNVEMSSHKHAMTRVNQHNVNSTSRESATANDLGTKQCTSDLVMGEANMRVEPTPKYVSTIGRDPLASWMQNRKIRQILGKPGLDKFTLHPIKQIITPFTRNPVLCLTNEDDLPKSKTMKRIAHNRNSCSPNPVLSNGIVIPIGFRQYYCNVFFEEFKKNMGEKKARSCAAQKELEIARNSKLTQTYKNNCTLMLVKYRKGECETLSRESEQKTNVKLTPGSCPDFTYGWTLYKCFSKYLLSEDQLRENGFPLALHDQPGCAYVAKDSRRYSSQRPSNKLLHRLCSNCSKEFEVDAQGRPLTRNDCFYHWGRLKKSHHQGQWQEIFTCCNGMVDSSPCESSQYHVWSGRDEDCLTGFVATPKLPPNKDKTDAGIYTLDCEMCYTTHGLELARLTVLDLNERVFFDQVVKLVNPVLNYCTRFSGIDAEKISKATYTFDDVRRWVLDHFFDKTILVGHSLENDLKALKLIHKTIVDTSVVFPHKFPQSKFSLKHLASSVLKIAIQEDENGHDSKEDAATCLKLMKSKIKEDSKMRKPRVLIQYNGKKS